MDFGKSLATSIIFDLVLPLASAAIKQGVPHGDAIATVLDTSKDIVRAAAIDRTAGTSVGDAVTSVLNNHMTNLVQAGTSVISKELPHGDMVMQAVEAYKKTLQH